MNKGIPDVESHMNWSMFDLFRNFTHNWDTLSPVTYLLYGTLAGFFFAALIKKKMMGDD